MPLPDADVQRTLVVAAHPDDIDFGVAGSVATWTAAGTHVTYLVCTYGGQGGFDDTPRHEVPAIREREQRASAKAVGVHDVRFLDGYADGSLAVTDDLVRDVVRVVRQVRPQRVVAPSPERTWDMLAASHPDHLAAGDATVRAVYPFARNPFAFPELLADEGLEPWAAPELWLVAHPAPDHVVDVTDAIDAKLAALAAHTSQTGHRDELEAMIREGLAGIARRAGLPHGRLAEAFKLVDSS